MTINNQSKAAMEAAKSLPDVSALQGARRGGLRRFVSRLGPTTAKKIFLTSMTLESEELLRIGFLTDLVEREGPASKDQCLPRKAFSLRAARRELNETAHRRHRSR